MFDRLHENLLTITLFLPVLGAGLIWAFCGTRQNGGAPLRLGDGAS